MFEPSLPPLGEPQVSYISAGDLVSTAARAVGANFVPFVVVALMCVVPAMGATVLQQELTIASWEAPSVDPYDPYDPYGGAGDPIGAADPFETFGDPLYWLAIVLGLLGGYVATAGIMFGTVEWMAGRRPSVGEVLTKSLARLGPVLVISLLTTIASAAGAMLCIAPGVIIWLTFTAAVPATVVERLGPIEAMKRSAELTEGHRSQIFVAMLAAFAIYVIFSCCFGGVLVGGGVAAMLPSGGDPAAMNTLPIRVVTYLFQTVQNVMTLLGNSTICAVFYARVRGIRDGVDARALADVFS